MSVLRPKAGSPGVLVFERVEVREDASQRAGAYLHVTGGSRELPSHEIRVFLNASDVSATSDRTHTAFAADFSVYNSPSPPGPSFPAHAGGPLAEIQGPQEWTVNVSEAISRLGPVSHVDVTLLFVSFKGAPLDVSMLVFDEMSITRRP